MVRKIKKDKKNKDYLLKELSRQEQDYIDEYEEVENIDEELADLEYETAYMTIDFDSEEYINNAETKYKFYIDRLTREEITLPSFSKIEKYDKKLTVRIGETEEKILNYLQQEKGENISELLRKYIRSLGKDLVDEKYIKNYNKLREEYNKTLVFIGRSQNYRKKLKRFRGVNSYTANLLARQRDLLKFKIKNLKSKAKKINYQLKKMEEILK